MFRTKHVIYSQKPSIDVRILSWASIGTRQRLAVPAFKNQWKIKEIIFTTHQLSFAQFLSTNFYFLIPNTPLTNFEGKKFASQTNNRLLKFTHLCRSARLIRVKTIYRLKLFPTMRRSTESIGNVQRMQTDHNNDTVTNFLARLARE